MALHHPLLLLLLVNWAVSGQDALTVHTPDGTVRGGVTETTVPVRYFFGIPFAAPPTGTNRFRSPQPVTPWSGVLDATQYKDDCVQDYGAWTSEPLWGSEDCLYLNVYTPMPDLQRNRTASGLLPVMVFIPGGGLWWESAGNTECPECPVANGIIRQLKDVVVVVAPYRVGAFGFLGGDALRSRGEDSSTGNWGIQDQRAALRWVQRSIRSFGGDPNNVMLWGQSSGAGSVSIHLVSPKSRGLFHKVGMMSGSFPNWTNFPKDAAEKAYQWVLLKTGCKGAEDEVACLVAKPTRELLLAQRPPGAPWSVGEPVPTPDPSCNPNYCWENVPCRAGSPYMPEIDGVELTDYPWKLLQRGHFAHVPVMQGKTLDDGRCFISDVVPLDENCSEDELWAWAAKTYEEPTGTLLGELKAKYRVSSFIPRAQGTRFSAAYFAASAMVSDFHEECPTARVSRVIASLGVPVYEYVFSYDNSYDAPFVDHSVDMMYSFSRMPYLNNRPVPDEAKRVSEAVVSYWTNFAHTGDPNTPPKGSKIKNIPEFPMFTDREYVVFEIGANHKEEYIKRVNYRRDLCDLWDAHWDYFYKCVPQPDRSGFQRPPESLGRTRPWCRMPLVNGTRRL